MNAKERFYSGLAKETIGKITSNTDNWTSFLRTMSRNYEFTYPEQVMIYAQRPNATFCKPYEDWNAENYRRYLNRFKYRESEMLEVLNMERSTYYDRKKEAILLFGLSLWGTAIPKLKDFLESAREEEALCYCEC